MFDNMGRETTKIKVYHGATDKYLQYDGTESNK